MKNNTNNTPCRIGLRKRVPSKLIPFTEQLIQMEEEHKSLTVMRAWLAEQGVTCCHANISAFLAARRMERLVDKIVSGSGKGRKIKDAFAKHPAPPLETLHQLLRMAIMELTLNGTAKPELLKLSGRLANTVFAATSAGETRSLKEREVAVKEQTLAETKKKDRLKALELCVEDSKRFPAVLELFRAAFAALKQAETSA